MRVATWNVNGLRARLGFVLHWLRARRPDLVGIQELKLEDEHFPSAELAELGYRSIAHCQRGWNGVAILARQPIEVVQRGLPGQDEMGARLLTARVEGIDFTTLYIPNGKYVGHEDFPRKLAWLDALAEHLERDCDPGRPAVVCGDFNLCPQPIDSWNEALLHRGIFHTDEERSRFQRLLDWGLVDVYRRLLPETRAFTWWDYRAGAFHKNEGLRIDLLLGTQPLATRATAAEIDREYRKKKDGLIASDHAPVMVELEA
ncbi:MAG TPA: exodeoxyribonuclease III [Thermoanaerobaculia bacterium]|nr:exodeoxyribonuclease III [Thermoanaerobaculia bacterium]